MSATKSLPQRSVDQATQLQKDLEKTTGIQILGEPKQKELDEWPSVSKSVPEYALSNTPLETFRRYVENKITDHPVLKHFWITVDFSDSELQGTDLVKILISPPRRMPEICTIEQQEVVCWIDAGYSENLNIIGQIPFIRENIASM